MIESYVCENSGVTGREIWLFIALNRAVLLRDTSIDIGKTTEKLVRYGNNTRVVRAYFQNHLQHCGGCKAFYDDVHTRSDLLRKILEE